MTLTDMMKLPVTEQTDGTYNDVLRVAWCIASSDYSSTPRSGWKTV